MKSDQKKKPQTRALAFGKFCNPTLMLGILMLNSDNKALCWVSVSMNRMGCEEAGRVAGTWSALNKIWLVEVTLPWCFGPHGSHSPLTQDFVWLLGGVLSLALFHCPSSPPSCRFSAGLSAHALPGAHSSFPLFLILPFENQFTQALCPFFRGHTGKIKYLKTFHS